MVKSALCRMPVDARFRRASEATDVQGQGSFSMKDESQLKPGMSVIRHTAAALSPFRPPSPVELSNFLHAASSTRSAFKVMYDRLCECLAHYHRTCRD